MHAALLHLSELVPHELAQFVAHYFRCNMMQHCPLGPTQRWHAHTHSDVTRVPVLSRRWLHIHVAINVGRCGSVAIAATRITMPVRGGRDSGRRWLLGNGCLRILDTKRDHWEAANNSYGSPPDFTHIISWLFLDYFMIMSWLFHDYVMIISWLCHDYFMIISWLFHDYVLIMAWLFHDYCLSIFWLCHDYFLIMPWVFPEHFLIMSWLFPDYFMIISWLFPDYFMVIATLFPDYFMIITWLFPD